MGLHGSLEITTCFGDCRGETNAESPLWPAKLFTVADAVAGSPERNGSPIGRGRDGIAASVATQEGGDSYSCNSFGGKFQL